VNEASVRAGAPGFQLEIAKMGNPERVGPGVALFLEGTGCSVEVWEAWERMVVGLRRAGRSVRVFAGARGGSVGSGVLGEGAAWAADAAGGPLRKGVCFQEQARPGEAAAHSTGSCRGTLKASLRVRRLFPTTDVPDRTPSSATSLQRG
jgi:anti-sigma factor RsiW